MAEELESHGRPVCLLGGGETVVNVVGAGKGGRNQVGVRFGPLTYLLSRFLKSGAFKRSRKRLSGESRVIKYETKSLKASCISLD